MSRRQAFTLALWALAAAPAAAAPTLEAWVSGRQILSTTYSEHQYSGSALTLSGSRGVAPNDVNSRAQADWGVLRVDGQAARVGSSFALAAFYDDLTITAPGIARGTPGVMTYSVWLDGDLDISNSHSAASWRLRSNFGGDGAFDIDAIGALCGANIPCSGAAPQTGLHWATADFFFGIAAPLVVSLRGDAAAMAATGAEPLSLARFDLGHSLYWAGIGSISANNVTLNQYNLASASGTDWRVSFVPTAVPVPEPASAVLTLTGLALVGFSLRRSGSRRERPARGASPA
jgi:PEP-CTERM motif